MGQKWPISCSYNLPKVLIREHLKLLSKNLDLQSSIYERFAFAGDFIVGMENKAMKNFSNSCRLTSLNNKPTCYKNPANPSCMNLIFTNCHKYFQNITVNKAGLSNFP